MSARLTINQASRELVLRVTERRDMKSVTLIASAGTGVTLFLLAALSGPTRIAALLVMALITGIKIISACQGADVQLRVSNLDFISNGRSPSDYHPSIIARADAIGLEFREANPGGAEFPDLPQGLYVVHVGALWSSATCVLPHANRVQCDEVIDAILERFPDTCTFPQSDNEKSHFILFNLSQPKSKP
jgi:hypothetical protein